MSAADTDTINGYPVIASWSTFAGSHRRAGRLVVVDRLAEFEERYVVAWHGNLDVNWTAPDYCLDLEEAARVFVQRVEAEVRAS